MDQIVKRPLSSLKDAPQNSRKHSEEQVAQIAKSMETFGWTIPVVIDEDGEIIAGHARVRAAKLLGLLEAPCLVAVGWSDEKKEAYQITDNRLSELSEWDTGILANQIKRLNALQFDLSFLDMSGFDVDLFKPTLTPEIGQAVVTGAEVAKTKQKLDAQFQPAPKATSNYTVICPDCGHEFDVQLAKE